MCGLFGALTTSAARAAEVASGVDVLGYLSEVRGSDSAGIASSRPDRGWQVERTLGGYAPALGADPTANTWLGHTRHATQGAHTLANASPSQVGPVIATHNGDVDITSIPRHLRTGKLAGSTDSHHLFRALSLLDPATLTYTAEVAQLLATVVGRVAMVWVDQRDPADRVWIARGGLSPLSIALDGDTVWWSSVPHWLNKVGVDPGKVHRLPPGSLWSLTRTPDGTIWDLQLHHKWSPTVRPSDWHLLHAVLRGFTTTDYAQERRRLLDRSA